MRRFILLLILALAVSAAAHPPGGRGLIETNDINPRAVTAGKLGAMPIIVRHANGTITSYGTVNDTDVQKGTALATALAAAAAGDTVEIGPGSYDMGVAQVTFPSGVSVRGAGHRVTQIISGFVYTAETERNVFSLGDNTTLADLWLNQDLVGVNYQFGVGPRTSCTAFLYRVRVTGDTDAVFMGKNNGNLTAYDCEFVAKTDAYNEYSSTVTGCTFTAYNSSLTAEASASGYLGATVARGIVGVNRSSSGRVKLYGCSLIISSTGTGGSIVVYGIQGATNDEYHNCVIATSAGDAAGNIQDVCLADNSTSTPLFDNCKGGGILGSLKTTTTTLRAMGAMSVEATETVSPAVAPITYTLTYGTDNGTYANLGRYHQIKVYAYKTVGGIRVYSSALTSDNITDNGTANTEFYIAWGWSPSIDPAIEGYLVTKYSTAAGYSMNHNKYHEVAGTSFNDIDDNYNELGGDDPEFEWTANVPTFVTTVPQQKYLGNLVVKGKAKTETGIGAVVSGKCTAVEYGEGTIHQTVLTFTLTGANDLDIPDGDDNGTGVKVYDFPEGRILILGATCDLSVTATNAAGGGGTFPMGLGTATAGTDNGALSGTEQDIIPSTAVTAGTSQAFDMALAASAQFDGTSAAKDLYANAAILNATSQGAVTIAVTGTVTVTWINLGDY